jgi:hypothetical protein
VIETVVDESLWLGWSVVLEVYVVGNMFSGHKQDLLPEDKPICQRFLFLNAEEVTG